MRINIKAFLQAAGYQSSPGQYVAWAEFRDTFRAYVAANGGNPRAWTKRKIQRLIGRKARPIGRGPGSVSIVGNLSKEFRGPRRWVAGPSGTVRLERPPAAP